MNWIRPFGTHTYERACGLVATGLCLAMAVLVGAQSNAARFAVASIKSCENQVTQGDRGGGARVTPRRLSLNCQNLMGLIWSAYVVYANGRNIGPGIALTTPIEGGPSWINTARYSIEATSEADVPAGVMQGPMLQALLEDRFKVKIRRLTRETPMYALVPAKGGAKLSVFQEGSCVPLPPPGDTPRLLELKPETCARGFKPGRPLTSPNFVYESEGITLEQFCTEFLSGPLAGLQRRVIDRTGLTGKFNVRLEYARPTLDPARAPLGGPATSSTDPTASGIETALQEQLGLKLEAINGPGEYLVLDHVERPSEN